MHKHRIGDVYGIAYLVKVSMDEANMSKAVVMLPKFRVLSTSSSYNLRSMSAV